MQVLDLNLASRPFRNNTLLWLGLGGGGLLVLLFMVWNVTTYLDYRGRLGEMRVTLSTIDSQMEQLQRRRLQANQVRVQRENDLPALSLQATKANEVIEWKAFSWTRLFNRLEQVQPWNVYMSSVRPIFRGESRGAAPDDGAHPGAVQIAVEGFAKDLTALLDFERALFRDPYFDHPEPERHALNDKGEVLFTLRFTYYPEDEIEAQAEADAAAEGATAEPGAAGSEAAPGAPETTAVAAAGAGEQTAATPPPEVAAEAQPGEPSTPPYVPPDAELQGQPPTEAVPDDAPPRRDATEEGRR